MPIISLVEFLENLSVMIEANNEPRSVGAMIVIFIVYLIPVALFGNIGERFFARHRIPEILERILYFRFRRYLTLHRYTIVGIIYQCYILFATSVALLLYFFQQDIVQSLIVNIYIRLAFYVAIVRFLFTFMYLLIFIVIIPMRRRK